MCVWNIYLTEIIILLNSPKQIFQKVIINDLPYQIFSLIFVGWFCYKVMLLLISFLFYLLSFLINKKPQLFSFSHDFLKHSVFERTHLVVMDCDMFQNWFHYLCEYMMTQQAPFIRRHVRKLLLFICGTKEKYRLYRDLHSLNSNIKVAQQSTQYQQYRKHNFSTFHLKVNTVERFMF